MSEAKMINLSKLKGMSGADIIALVQAGGFSLEINGEHIGDVVRPLNALDEHFIAVSHYIATEVAAEMKRKAETLKVEDMFNPRTTQDILDAVAEKVVLEAPKAPETVEEKPAKPAKSAKPAKQSRSRAKPAPAAKPKPKRVRSKPAQPKASDLEAEAVPTPADEQDLHLSPFPDTTEPEDDTPIEDILSQEDSLSAAVSDASIAEDVETASAAVIENDKTAADAAFDADFDADDDIPEDIPTLAEGDSEAPDADEEVPADALFEDLLLDEDDNLVSEDATLAAEEQDDDDIFGDDTPLVRKMVRRT